MSSYFLSLVVVGFAALASSSASTRLVSETTEALSAIKEVLISVIAALNCVCVMTIVLPSQSAQYGCTEQLL